MDLCSISDLTQQSINKTMELQVYRKWIAKSPPEMTAYASCCILLDWQGDAIQANMALKDWSYFNDKLQLHMAYWITECFCEVTSSYQQTLESPTSLRFGKHTNFDAISPTSFPHHYFHFTSYNQLESNLPTPNATEKLRYTILTGHDKKRQNRTKKGKNR